MNSGNPHFCDITISPRCVLQCRMCRAWHAPVDSPAISFEDAKRFVDELAEFVTGEFEINVMGGEPLMVPWCLDLCDYIADKGFRSIISTNAYLIDEDMAKRICDSKLNVLAISLESLNPVIHDKNRGKNGVHERVMQAIDLLSKYRRDDLCVTILSIIMKENLDEIIPLAKWVNSNDLFQNISYLALLETGLVNDCKEWWKHEKYKVLWPDDHPKLVEVLNQLIHLRAKGYKIWNPYSQLEAFKEYYHNPIDFMKNTSYSMHDFIVDLDERKNIYLSGEKLSELYQMPLKEAWFSSKANDIRARISEFGFGERSCVINFVCAFPDDKIFLQDDNNCVLREHIERKSQEEIIEKVNFSESIRVPKFSVIEVTRDCPMKCEMCFNWQAEPVKGLITDDDVKRYIDQLAGFVKKPFEINLAGGEPLARKNVFDIVRYIISKDFTVSLTTAGYLLDDPMLDRIRESGLTLMPVSLDSLDEEVHDKLRGRKGTHKKVMHAFDVLTKDRGCLRNLTIQTIIMRPNLDGIVDLVKWANDRDIAVSLMALMRPNGLPVDANWYKDKKYEHLWPNNRREINRTIDALIKLKNNNARIDTSIAQLEAFKEYYRKPTVFIKDGPCSLGDGIMNVAPDGNVYLCWEKGALGNIKYDNIYNLWYSARAKKIRESIIRCRKNCSEMVNCFFEGQSKVSLTKLFADFFKAKFFKGKIF